MTLRIAYTCADPGIPVFGCKGASVHVQGVLGAMQRRGATVTLFATRPGGTPGRALDGVSLVPLDAAPLSRTAHPQIEVFNQALDAALEAAGPFDLVYERYSLWSFAAMSYARRHGIPGILEVNAPLIEEQATHRALSDRAGAERVAGRAFGEAHTIVAVSDEVATWVRDLVYSQASIVVEPNGVDTARFSARRPAAGAPFTVGFIGTLKPWHGLDVMAEAFALVAQRIPGARLLVVGDGPGREGLLAQLSVLGVASQVEFTGAMAPDRVDEAFTRMHVALAPYPASSDFYFSPLKVVEYQAAAIPVVASAIGQIPALITHGQTGWLVPPGDARAFADACVEIHRSPAMAARIAEQARAHVVRHRSWDAVVDRVLAEARREVVGRRPMPGGECMLPCGVLI